MSILILFLKYLYLIWIWPF